MTKGIVPTFFIETDSIPEAYYKAMDTVWHKGMPKRTQYDLKNEQGDYIHPPSKDAQVIIKINDVFSQPRFPPISFCEIGAYFLEMLGIKNHLVVPREKLLKTGEKGLKETEWPYAYNQRLSESPTGYLPIDQIENVIERLSEDTNTRRAVMTTRVPQLDTLLKTDLPCLGEVHLRCFEDEGNDILNMTTLWRSRDLYKAWSDNVLAITYFGRKIAEEIGKRTGRKTILKGYTDYSNSLHIYGQDFMAVHGDKEVEKKGFFEVFPNVEACIKRSRDSETVRESLIIPEMKGLLTEKKQKEWHFTDEEKEFIRGEINLLEQGLLP